MCIVCHTLVIWDLFHFLITGLASTHLCYLGPVIDLLITGLSYIRFSYNRKFLSNNKEQFCWDPACPFLISGFAYIRLSYNRSALYILVWHNLFTKTVQDKIIQICLVCQAINHQSWTDAWLSASNIHVYMSQLRNNTAVCHSVTMLSYGCIIPGWRYMYTINYAYWCYRFTP
jgi:hypothetical protein